MVGLGLAREDRKFTPHLTLGRIKYIRSRDRWLEDHWKRSRTSDCLGFEATAVSLMKSELKPAGAVYTEMGRVELR